MDTKKKTKTIRYRYQLLALVLLLLAAGLVALPKYQKQEGIKSEVLLSHAVSSERYISTDKLAHKIISLDPSFILIDVRDESQYTAYSLPNAINIPLENLLNDESINYLNQDQFDVVLFSNDNFYADQAWLLCDRLGFKNLRVLKGGLNQWFSTIINPEKPTENMPSDAFKVYAMRKAASMYFGVVYPDQITDHSSTQKSTPKKVVTIKKKKKRVAEGGC